MYVRTYVCMHACMHACMYACLCVYAYVFWPCRERFDSIRYLRRIGSIRFDYEKMDRFVSIRFGRKMLCDLIRFDLNMQNTRNSIRFDSTIAILPWFDYFHSFDCICVCLTTVCTCTYFTSVHISTHQYTSVHISTHRYASVRISSHQSYIGAHQYTSVHISTHAYINTYIHTYIH